MKTGSFPAEETGGQVGNRHLRWHDIWKISSHVAAKEASEKEQGSPKILGKLKVLKKTLLEER